MSSKQVCDLRFNLFKAVLELNEGHRPPPSIQSHLADPVPGQRLGSIIHTELLAASKIVSNLSLTMLTSEISTHLIPILAVAHYWSNAHR